MLNPVPGSVGSTGNGGGLPPGGNNSGLVPHSPEQNSRGSRNNSETSSTHTEVAQDTALANDKRFANFLYEKAVRNPRGSAAPRLTREQFDLSDSNPLN